MGVMMQAFYWDCPRIEGIPFGWWAHLQTKVPELAGVGFTALWLPPAILSLKSPQETGRSFAGGAS